MDVGHGLLSSEKLQIPLCPLLATNSTAAKETSVDWGLKRLARNTELQFTVTLTYVSTSSIAACGCTVEVEVFDQYSSSMLRFYLQHLKLSPACQVVFAI